MKLLIGLVSLASLLVQGACLALASPEPGIHLTAATLTASPAHNPPTSTMESPSSTVQKMVRLSMEHLSRRLSMSVDQITLVEMTPVTWKDASLGCPKPGIDYIRVETPGYSILLRAGGNSYSYHTDQDKRVILCANAATKNP